MSDLYRFDYRVVDADDEGYYHTRWDRATPIAVVAPTEPEALKKVWAVMGDAPRGRHWTARLKTVTDTRLTEEAAADAAISHGYLRHHGLTAANGEAYIVHGVPAPDTETTVQ